MSSITDFNDRGSWTVQSGLFPYHDLVTIEKLNRKLHGIQEINLDLVESNECLKFRKNAT